MRSRDRLVSLVGIATIALAGGGAGCSSSSSGGGDGGRGGASGSTGAGGSSTGAGGGSTGVGGATGAGGSAADASSGGDGALATMSFFATSRGPGDGGNLGGLDGADMFCRTLAMAVSTTLGAKTWHAYLSTSTVNARDRIGTGPWRNAAGRIIADNLTNLHSQFPDAGALLDTTWPTADTSIALDETGAPVPATGSNVHDILTGSNADGTVLAGSTCNNWTSSAMTDTAGVGHSNRSGGGRPLSWNAAHTVGCAQNAPGTNNQANTVSSGGGRGSIYCFAVP